MKPYITRHFLEAYQNLNDTQRQAVEAIDGPVLVIAGPGTGKTQILAARIGNILLKTDTRPENILCLTYTDSGTIAMRKRLLQFIGPDAYKVGIFTFHAFCNQVIQENLDYFGFRELQPVSQLEQRQLIEKLIDNFDSNHPLKRWTGDVYYDSPRLLQLFQLMKTENWSYEYIAQQADSYIAGLYSREEFLYKRKSSNNQQGSVKQHKIDAEIRKMNELKAAAAAFSEYEKLMTASKRYDYDDMIVWVLHAFQKESYLLARYQEQYHYFLVDEYQDTNGSQNAILRQLVSNPVNEGKPNVMVVGDDDQSIFRFQGANVQNIMDFFFEFKDHITTIVLTDNYRSSQHILNLSKHLIDQNEERLIKKIKGLDKNLNARNQKFARSAIQPEIRVYPNLAQETAGIANEIERMKNENFPLEEIAVIYRMHRQSDELIKLLRAKNIPVNVRRQSDILQSVFILNILKILEYIDAESKQSHSREDLLFEILHQAWFGIDSLLIAEIAMHIRKKSKSDKPLHWRTEIQKYSANHEANLFNSETIQKYSALKRTSDDLEYWIKERHNISLQLLIEKIITRGGILRYVMTSSEKIRLLEELHTFYDFVKSETQKNTTLDITGLIQTIQLYRKYNLSIGIENTSAAEKGVNFITAHSSKGLEFERVFLIGCDKNSWDKTERSNTFTLPDNLMPQHKQGDESEEARRLFYVAMTRAKEHLYISYAEKNNQGKELEKSRFVAELSESNLVKEQRIELSAAEMAAYHHLAMQEEQIPEVKMAEKVFLQKELESFKLNVTALNTYLKCPLSFYYNNVLRIPQAKSEAMTFGSAIHAALNFFFKKMQQNNMQFPPTDVLLSDYEHYLKMHRDAFNTEESFKRKLEYGKQILSKYVDQYLNSWHKNVQTERTLDTHFNGIPIRGIIDKIEYLGHNKVNVIDYKTGNYANAKKQLSPPVTTGDNNAQQTSFEAKYGGDYWRQAVFYKILIDYYWQNEWDVASVEFDFIEPDKKTQTFFKEKVEITSADVKMVKEQIIQAYNQIINLEFSRGCNEPDCKWCTFVKHHFSLLIEKEELT
jgi:DNA helicase-2/ATP-dependent DNA helicase PcrA